MKLILTCFLFAGAIQAQTFWARLNDLPGPERDDGVAVSAGNQLYFGTGFCSNGSFGADFYALDPTTLNWQTLPVMPVNAGRQYACAFAGPNCFFVFGGDNAGGSLNTLYKYDIQTSAWIAKASKPGIGLSGACCLVFGDKLIIAGGKAQGSTPVSEVWEYTISSDSWLQKNNFPFGGRFRASAAVLNGTGYLMFGADANSHFRKDMYSYTQSTDTWTKLMDFPQPAARVYASLSPISNKLILFGGIDSTLACYNDIWYYTPANNSWEQSSNFSSLARKGGMAAVAGTKFVYSCGITQNSARLKETWIADIPVGLRTEQQEPRFTVSPNPAKDLLYIQSEGSNDLTAIVVTDIAGKELISASNEGHLTSLSINISGLSTGIYFLKVQQGNDVSWKKILKE
jgi:N-acetylneuraminic acid mutarotase